MNLIENLVLVWSDINFNPKSLKVLLDAKSLLRYQANVFYPVNYNRYPLMSENCEGSICMSLHHHHMTHDSSVRDLIVMQAGIMSPSLIYSVGGKTDISHLKQEPISLQLIQFDNISILHQKKESDAKHT